MTDYVCVDGPLKGRLFRWRKPPRVGEPMTVALLDVDHGVLEVDYRPHPPVEPSGSGRLEFVAARDARIERSWLRLPPRREPRSAARGRRRRFLGAHA